MTPLEESFTIAVASLKAGEVVSFGDIALRAGRPHAARAAGAFLSKSLITLPWWRVVYADGRLPPCDPTAQAAFLADEGVVVRDNRVTRAPLGRFAKH
jgi:methylated-DNA-protein-cysteine methyltransferase-like protein